MAEQLLHHPDVGAVVEHVGRARVAQHVRGQPVAEPGAVARGAHDQPAPWRVSRPPRALRNTAPTRAPRDRAALEHGRPSR